MYEGDYDYWAYKRAELEGGQVADGSGPSGSMARSTSASASSAPEASSAAREKKSKDDKRVEAETRNRLYRGTKDAKRRLSSVERELSGVTARHEELLAVLGDTGLYEDKALFSATMEEYTTIKRRLGDLEAEWLELSERIEAMQSGDAESL